MSIQVECSCGQQFEAGENLAGKRVKCPKCQQILQIPAEETANAAVAIPNMASTSTNEETTRTKRLRVVAAIVGLVVMLPIATGLGYWIGVITDVSPKPQTEVAHADDEPQPSGPDENPADQQPLTTNPNRKSAAKSQDESRQPGSPPQDADTNPLPYSLFPDKQFLVVEVNVKDLLDASQQRGLSREGLHWLLVDHMREDQLDDVMRTAETVWFWMHETDEEPFVSFGLYARFLKPQDRDAFIERNLPDSTKEQHQQQDYYRWSSGAGFKEFGERDLFGSEIASVHAVLEGRHVTNQSLANRIRNLSGQAKLVVNVEPIRKNLARDERTRESLPFSLEQLDWLKRVDVALDLTATPALAVQGKANSPENATQAATLLKSLVQMSQAAIGHQRKEIQTNKERMESGDRGGIVTYHSALEVEHFSEPYDNLLALIEGLIQKLEAESKGSQVHLRLPEVNEITKFSDEITRLKEASDEIDRLMVFSNMTTAVASYSGTYSGRLSTNLANEFGHHLLSWRFQLLPYLEYQSLYDQFHRDEPWDSEHNKTLIDQFPALYATGLGDDKFMTTWKLLPSIPDGILFVKGGRGSEVVWTKPDYVQLDPDDPLQAFGEPPKDGFMILEYGESAVVKLTPEELSQRIRNGLAAAAKAKYVVPGSAGPPRGAPASGDAPLATESSQQKLKRLRTPPATGQSKYDAHYSIQVVEKLPQHPESGDLQLGQYSAALTSPWSQNVPQFPPGRFRHQVANEKVSWDGKSVEGEKWVCVPIPGHHLSKITIWRSDEIPVPLFQLPTILTDAITIPRGCARFAIETMDRQGRTGTLEGQFTKETSFKLGDRTIAAYEFACVLTQEDGKANMTVLVSDQVPQGTCGVNFQMTEPPAGEEKYYLRDAREIEPGPGFKMFESRGFGFAPPVGFAASKPLGDEVARYTAKDGRFIAITASADGGEWE